MNINKKYVMSMLRIWRKIKNFDNRGVNCDTITAIVM